MAKTVCIIDDDLSLQLVLEIALHDAGFKVVAAGDGVEGLKLLQTIQPDLVLCDVMMPQMDGVQFFNHIRERLQGEGVPIIIMTALARKPWFTDLEDEGAVILQKPFNMERLMQLVHALVDE